MLGFSCGPWITKRENETAPNLVTKRKLATIQVEGISGIKIYYLFQAKSGPHWNQGKILNIKRMNNKNKQIK